MNRKQPVCLGVDPKGELVWGAVPMELWQVMQLFYKHYCGDFPEQWMRLSLYYRGLEWQKD